MYTLIQRQKAYCDVFLDGKLIGAWIGLIFYPEPDYKGVPISLMQFLIGEK